MAKFRTRRGRGRGWTCEFERDRAKEGRKERKKGRKEKIGSLVYLYRVNVNLYLID